jgi:hypothetical protein
LTKPTQKRTQQKITPIRPSSNSSPDTSSEPTARRVRRGKQAKTALGSQREKEALRRCGIKHSDLETAYPISDILEGQASPEMIAPRLRASKSEHAEKWLKYWDGLPKGDRKYLSLEAVCVGADVSPESMLGAIVVSLRERTLQKSALKAVLAHPEVMDATIQSAQLLGPAGAPDRKVLHSMPAIGFLPGPQGSQFQVNLGVLNAPPQQHALSAGDDDDDEPDINDVLLPITGVLEHWNDDRRKLLKSPEN